MPKENIIEKINEALYAEIEDHYKNFSVLHEARAFLKLLLKENQELKLKVAGLEKTEFVSK